jgi:serine/threonine-protein kinase
MTLVAGTRLGPYEIVSPLGAGGMGEVYKARDPRLGRDVAIKVLPASFATDASRLHRFEQEARAVAALSHPNILAIFDIGAGDHPYLVTELLEGETLRATIERGPLGLKRTTDVALQLVAGLAAAHGRGIVHRDLKPDNIFLTRDGVVKILDFGLAKQGARSAGEAGEAGLTIAATSAGLILGTVGYMAPEQVRGETADPRADLFAVGTIIYEMVSGQRAFHGDSPADTMSAVLREQPPDLVLRTGTPPALARIVRRCLEKDSSERFQSARDLRFAIESISDLQPAAPQAAKPTDEKSVAVLPFANMSADPENQFFSDGLAEELINALTGLPGLHVASRTSSFRFRGRDADIKEIGTQLQVATVLEGSVRRAGTRLRVTAQLTSVADGYHLWSERYDREMTDVFAIQDDIVEAIVKAIAPALAGAAKTTVKRATENVEAYELYLKARHFWLQRTPSTLQMAIKLFEQVIALDPEHALAYAGLADCYSIYRVYGWFRADTAQPRVREAVSRAVTLEPELPEVHFAQALYAFYFERHWREGIDHLRRAIAINPRYAIAHVYLGAFFACDGRVDETVAACERAYALEPLSPIVLFLQSASLSTVGRRFDDAEATARRLLDLQPDALVACWPLTLALLGLGRFDEAVGASERLLTLSRASIYMGLAGLAYAKADRIGDARRLLGELDERAIRGEYIAPFGPLAINVGLGDTSEVRRLLEACVADRTPPLSIAVTSSLHLDAYRADPEINRLLNAIFDRPPESRT